MDLRQEEEGEEDGTGGAWEAMEGRLGGGENVAATA